MTPKNTPKGVTPKGGDNKTPKGLTPKGTPKGLTPKGTPKGSPQELMSKGTPKGVTPKGTPKGNKGATPKNTPIGTRKSDESPQQSNKMQNGKPLGAFKTPQPQVQILFVYSPALCF